MLKVKAFVFNPIQENTYLLYNERGKCIIIDPGCYYPEENEVLQAYISKSGLQCQLLLNTHCHLDHVFGNKYVAEKYGLKLHIHANEKQMLDLAPASGLLYNLPFDNYAGEIDYIPDSGKIYFDEEELEILFTPGHSPGHLSFYNQKAGFVISGDALFYRSIGRTDLPGGDFDTLIQSIRNKLFALPDETIVYSGHGPQTSIGEEKLENPFLV